MSRAAGMLFLFILFVVFDMCTGNPPCTWIWVPRVRVPMAFSEPMAVPVPLSPKPVPALAGTDTLWLRYTVYYSI